MVDGPYERFSRLFRGRERGIWERSPSGSEDTAVFLPEATFTPERFVEHVSGEGRSYGIHLLDGRNRVNFCMYDMDAYPRNAPAPEMLRNLRALKPQVERMRDALYRLGVAPENQLLEFSGTGYHLWMFYARPQTAERVRGWMGAAMGRAGIEGHTFKPMRIAVTERHNGDKVWLPLRVNANQGKRSVFVADLEAFDPADYDQRLDFSALEQVVPLDDERLARIVAAAGDSRLG